MKKTETIEAIDNLIEKYKGNISNAEFGQFSSCPFCQIYTIPGDEDPDCNKCINSVFAVKNYTYPCVARTNNYYLDWYCDKEDLVKFWTSVKNFLTPLQEDIEIEDIKPHILKLAEPFKK